MTGDKNVNYKEFIIANTGAYDHIEPINNTPLYTLVDDLHVIEYSAFEALQKENEKLRVALKLASEKLYQCGEYLEFDMHSTPLKLNEAVKEINQALSEAKGSE